MRQQITIAWNYGIAIVQRALRALYRQERAEEISITEGPPPIPATPEELPAYPWRFKRDILDQLERYADCARRLRAFDPQVYVTCTRLGAALSEHNAAAPAHMLTGARVAFGAVAFMGSRADWGDRTLWRFAYFEKLQYAIGVQHCIGDIYRVVLVFDEDGSDGRFTVPVSYYVGVSAEGDVRVLKERATRIMSIRVRNPASRRRHSDAFYVPQIGWDYPNNLKMILRSSVDKKPAQDFGAFAFAWSYQMYLANTSDVRIAATKNAVTCAFSVDLKRLPYFFKDRDFVPNEQGSRRRIFHAVREHDRVLADGRMIGVKFHYRGSRDFSWNGHDIKITVQGEHHADMREMGFAGKEVDAMELMPDGAISGIKMIEFIRNATRV